MLLNAKNVIGLPAETESKQKLGKVYDFDIEISSHIIKSYSIEGGFLSSKKLLISRNQVVSIDKEKMVVKDSVIKEEIKNLEGVKIKPKTEPALSMNLSQDEMSNS